MTKNDLTITADDKHQLPVIAIMAGGFSAESDISLQSATQVYKHLNQNGQYEPVMIHVNREGWIAEPGSHPVDLNDFSFVRNDERIQPVAAFIAIHGSPGEDGCLQAYFDMMQVPYTGCGRLTAALTFNKDFCKKATRGSTAKLAPSILVHSKMDLREQLKTIYEQLNFPLFVKPNQNGSSYGISKVDTGEDLETAIRLGFKYDSELLIEAGVEGRELTCGVFSTDGKPKTLPITEIVHQSSFFDYSAKYSQGGAEEIVPANIDEKQAEICRQLSKELYSQLGCEGLVRFDYIYDGKDFWFLEVNTVPGLSEASIVPRMIRATGRSEGEFYAMLVEEALSQSPLVFTTKAR